MSIPAARSVSSACPARSPHEVKGADLIIHLPVLTGDQIPCQHAYSFKIEGARLDPE